MAIDPDVLRYADSLFNHRLSEEIRPAHFARIREARKRFPTSPELPFSGVEAQRLIEMETQFAKEAAIAQVECLATALTKSGLDFNDEAFRKGMDDTRELLERHKQNTIRTVSSAFTQRGKPPEQTSREALERTVDATMAHIHDSVLGWLKVKLHESILTVRTAAQQPANRADEDQRYARLAIEEARKSVSELDGKPHPKVGAVVVKNGRLLSAAHRGEWPENHAEFIALEKKLSDEVIVGSTVYTTLEPCTTRNHPKIPCAARLVERKVARVVIGMLDPDPRITGRGILKLRNANIAIGLFSPDLMTEVEELNREFKRYCEQNSQTQPEPTESVTSTHGTVAPIPPPMSGSVKSPKQVNSTDELTRSEIQGLFRRTEIRRDFHGQFIEVLCSPEGRGWKRNEVSHKYVGDYPCPKELEALMEQFKVDSSIREYFGLHKCPPLAIADDKSLLEFELYGGTWHHVSTLSKIYQNRFSDPKCMKFRIQFQDEWIKYSEQAPLVSSPLYHNVNAETIVLSSDGRLVLAKRNEGLLYGGAWSASIEEQMLRRDPEQTKREGDRHLFDAPERGAREELGVTILPQETTLLSVGIEWGNFTAAFLFVVRCKETFEEIVNCWQSVRHDPNEAIALDSIEADADVAKEISKLRLYNPSSYWARRVDVKKPEGDWHPTSEARLLALSDYLKYSGE
jgi:pyrimidine deaminase RibD-like protein